MLIRCNMCESVFQEEQINYDYKNDKEYCPNCGTSGCLMDLKLDTKYDLRDVINFLKEFLKQIKEV